MVSVGDKATAAWANQHPAAASGIFTMPAPSALNTPVTQVITFPAGRFSIAPAIVPTVLGGTPQNFEVGVSATNGVTGATITMVQTAGPLTSRLIHWIAVEPT